MRVPFSAGRCQRRAHSCATLVEHATQPQFVYSHKWRQWDLVMWDNRQVMHRVTRFDDTQVRDMRRTTVAGDAMTVAQAA